MTSTAVNFKNAELERENAKRIADAKNQLNKYIADNQLQVDIDKLIEAARHNQAEEYLRKADIKISRDLRVMEDLGRMVRHLLPSGSDMSKQSANVAAYAMNDISWHNKLTVAFEQAVKLPQNHRSGLRYYTRNAEDKSTSDNVLFSVYGDNNIGVDTQYPEGSGGIAVLYYTPVLEHDDDQVEVSELQNAIRRMFVPVRQANSGAVNYYDQSDMMQVVLACSSIAEMVTYLARCLKCVHPDHRTMNTYDAWDTHKLSLLVGDYTNAEYWIQNTPLIIEAINSIIRSVNSILLPIGFDITKRRQLLNSCIFGHHDLLRSEEYLFIPTIYYVYDEANSTLVATKFKPSIDLKTASSIKAMLYKMVQPIINGTVTSIMLGDMNKAYPNQTMILPEISYDIVGDTTNLYSEDEHVLDSIRNADIAYGPIEAIGTDADLSQYHIKQGINGTLDTYIYQGTVHPNGVCEIVPPSVGAKTNGLGDGDSTGEGDLSSIMLYRSLVAAGADYDQDKVATFTFLSSLDVKDDVASPEEIMIATRFKHRAKIFYSYQRDDDNSSNIIHQGNLIITHTGTELINQVHYYGFTKLGYSGNYITLIGVQNPYYCQMLNYPLVNTINKGWYVNAAFTENMNFIRNSFHYVPCCTYFRVRPNDDFSDLTTVADVISNASIRGGVEKFGRTNYNRINLTATEFKYLNIASFGSLVMPQAGSETSVSVKTSGGGSSRGRNRSKNEDPNPEK